MRQGTSGGADLGLYVHVPFCERVCPYCDFAVVAVGRLGAPDEAAYLDSLLAEWALVRGEVAGRPVASVYFGGGTPGLARPWTLARLLDAFRAELRFADPEITVELNPGRLEVEGVAALRACGVTRLSLGLQSLDDTILRRLGRAQSGAEARAGLEACLAAGFASLSIDLIYGAPGQDAAALLRDVDAVLDYGVPHVSAYALTLEPGTRMTAAVRAGRLPAPDEGALARRYELADARLSAAGLRWYEVSNWAGADAARCRHNLGYWTGGHWWALGPGAHGHVGGVRFWTHRHPATHARAVAAGAPPVDGWEALDPGARALERLMLETRLATGLDLGLLDARGRARAGELAADGLLELQDGRAVLTLRGRRLADGVIRALA